MVQGPIEQIRGKKVEMEAGWTMVHWSGNKFDKMVSTEIHEFSNLDPKLSVGVSFYLHKGAPPANQPKGLKLAGIGGGYRYTIDPTLGNKMQIYYKTDPNNNPAEVTVKLGCGGTITFNQDRKATGYNQTNKNPVIKK